MDEYDAYLYDEASAGDAACIDALKWRANNRNDYTIVHTKGGDQNSERVEFIHEDAYIFDADTLYRAAIAGDTDAISQFERRHDMLNSRKETILHIESRNGNTKRVRFILRQFAHKNILAKLDKHERTALHWAASFGWTEVAEILIDAARHLPPPPPSDNDNYPHDNPAVTSFQAFLRQADIYQNTALHAAVMGGHAYIVKLLVEADPSDTHIQNRYERTPMYIAVEKGFNDIVEIISTTCTAPSLDGPHGATALHIKNLDQAKSPGETLYKIMDGDGLYAAAIAGDADAIAILEKKADILHIESRYGYTERVQFILRELADKNLLAKLDKHKRTALHWAVDRGHTEVAEILIDAARHNLPPPPSDDNNNTDHDNPAVTPFQAFLRQADEDLNTALHAAVMGGHTSIVKLLVEADPSDTHIQNRDGRTPMYIAVERGFDHVVAIISRICTAPSLDGPYGATALHAAIKYHHDIEVVNLLIGVAGRLHPCSDNDNPAVTPFQAFLRRGDEEKNSALHIAVMQGNMDIVKLLVEADPSDTHIQNNQGKTPIYIAVENRRIDILKVICTTCTVSPNLDGCVGISKTTALHAAIKNLNQARKEDTDVIRLIIDTVKRANDHQDRLVELFKRTDEKKCIILELAVEGNHLDVLKLILAENPSYHQPCYTSSDFPDLLGIMPLIYKAKDKNYNDMVILLTETYQRVQLNFKALHLILHNMPELISAIGSRNEESVFNLLSDRRYDEYSVKYLVTFADNLGWTALHHAAYHEFDSIIPKIVEAQQKFRHDSFVYQDMVSTPFHVAAQKGNTSTVKLLLELWPSSSSSAYIAVDKNGQNILHLAALQSKKEMILDILKKCPEEYKEEFVNKQDNNGNTPLHLLIEHGCLVPELFKYRGLDIWVQNKGNWTPPDMLYFEDEIIGDQVRIKVALDGMRLIDPTRDIFSSSVVPSKRERKDVLLKDKAERMTHEEYARIKDDTHHHAIANCFAHAIAGDPISKAALEMKAAAADTLLNESAGETILHVESKKGDIENVRFIVGGAFANKSLLGKLDGLKQTALHLAADNGHTQVVELLIEAAARHDFPSSSSSANVHDAHNTVGSFQDFLRQADVPNRNTPLHLAVLKGNLEIVKLLVEADPNDKHVQNNEGKTPIYIAAEKGYKDIVKVICTTCTALSLDGPPCRTSTTARTTALHALIQNIGQVTEGANDVIRMMVDAAKGWSSADFEALFTRVDESGRTVLQLAVDRNDVDAVKLIIREDPAYQHGGEIKRNGLMRLIFKAINDQRSDDIIKSISEAYNVGINPDHKDVLALILAIQSLDEDSVLRLLRDAKHLATFTEDINGWTPLHYAVYLEFDSILDVIIKAQKDAGHPFEYGNMESTPFYIAVKHGYTSTLVRLMELWPASPSVDIAKSPYTIVDKDGRNILHLAAAAYNRKEMVQGILKYCPEKYKDEILKQKDKINGDTPLHLLISHGYFIPELIIKHKGLDTMAKNNQNYTPRDMLYVGDGIVGDQVHIKIALDEFQTNQSVRKLWPKRTEKKTDIWKCNKVPPSKRKIKDGKFEAGKKKLMDDKHEQMKKDLQRYKKRTNTQIIVTALITTVTFTVGFTMPGGLHQSGEVDEGMVVFSRNRAFNVFMVSDALALLMSTLSLFFYFLESMNEDPHQVQILNASSTVLNILSVMGMMLTFIAGTYVVLSDSPVLAIAVCIIGSLFFLIIIILWIIKIVYGRYVKNNKD